MTFWLPPHRTRLCLPAIGLMAMLIGPTLGLAQSVGTPGTGPLVPGGPRQGLGPPSLSDSVPDLRLRAPGGGIPGAGPPIDYGRPPSSGASGLGVSPRVQAVGRFCETPRITCRLGRTALLGQLCSCRGRGRGVVVR
ncbi:MAG: hypothetical protein Q8S58_09065 [Bosea sp. (in: a-proteobacteria)]|uniref:hypothetical protein n=1 Tax=Bosea sp. (in: a-proteobacteria) TaxID=1871050 RepID=UPI0027362679|nr:hypothetical protein [Bosea sp. (in: a-proteobacteria)]MDP3258335.1 hypothetical protein [Bosea sp. (in: a-proteobacteria)]MDP3319268.1 hypothetical protein [Bosea sp. (in: a-proteobacteria)]